MQKTVSKILISFFILIVFFSILSRAADSVTIPKVTTVTLNSRILEDTLTVDGKIRKDKVVPIFMEPNQKIGNINVYVGQKVSKEDVLVEIDLEYLLQQINQKQSDIQKIELSIQSAELKRQDDEKERNLNIKQAEESYEQIVAIEEAKIEQATIELEQAYSKLYETDSSEISQEELLAIYDEKQNNLQVLIRDKEAAILQAKQVLETAQLESSELLDINEYEVELSKVQNECNQLVNLQENEGMIRASADGIVSKINISIGGMTSNEAAILLEDMNSDNVMVMQIEKDKEEYVAFGQQGTVIGITEDGTENMYQSATVFETKINEENSDLLDVKVNLGQENYMYGSKSSFEIIKSSQQYSDCLPISAIHEDLNGYYVFILEEKKGILGSEEIATAVKIDIIDRNFSMVAIKEQLLLKNEKIIIEINKTIKNGDRVHVTEVKND